MTERRPPCLYLLWPRTRRDVQEPRIREGYLLREYRDTHNANLLELLRSDGEEMKEGHWHSYRDMLLPDGLFLIEHLADARLVATAGAVHNPNPGCYYFPFGGELGYLVVAPEHRGQGLGTVVCVAVVRRLISAGYNSIRVCVQEYRLPAIRSYLRLGFEPFLHSEEVELRWERICNLLNIRFTPEAWPKRLTSGCGKSA
jgi:mycothiol synthase